MRFPYDEWNNALKYYSPTSKRINDEEKENKSHRIVPEIKS